ncbi:uncharacterized protein PFL1_03442 [Pseudozyma flocculosa PF-1]|uniref:Related to 50S ribosomal protein L1 n=2 Tax=Pseudozyma flocculosa TaxID=84751 RepID=A0A5C3FDW2_9BASI|nr:uncharacterized protein PFL1_03442 [Pseudozyma flocculosa PF-1]EPQ29155.1 hypothetical protein PFL1_03442 [Pseudozyma flocculosa PF-1]SPO41549.1 related to 50S ribosomal protein L1 [Pseudozyma flocculosa]
MAALFPASCRSTPLLVATARLQLSSASTSTAARTFTTSQPSFKKSNRARGASRKSPRNLAILASLSPRIATAAQASSAKSKKAANPLEPKEGETLLTLEQACEQLSAKEGKKRPLNAYELHIVTTVSTHQTNALRGRISFPRDPRNKQEKLLIFAEEGSEANESVKKILAEEKARLGIPASAVAAAPAIEPTPEPTPAVAEASGEAATEASSSSSDSTSTSTSSSTSSEATASESAAQSKVSVYEPSIILGGSELISSVLNNRVSGFTKVLCTQSLLGEVSKSLARSLGPKGLMPNPRRGTVVPSDDANKILNAIKEARGATDWRSDKIGVVRGAVGRLNFDKGEVRKNVVTLLDAILEKVPTLGNQAGANQVAGQAKEYVERPQRTPGELKRAAGMIKQIHISSTQGPAYKLDLRDILA